MPNYLRSMPNFREAFLWHNSSASTKSTLGPAMNLEHRICILLLLSAKWRNITFLSPKHHTPWRCALEKEGLSSYHISPLRILNKVMIKYFDLIIRHFSFYDLVLRLWRLDPAEIFVALLLHLRFITIKFAKNIDTLKSQNENFCRKTFCILGSNKNFAEH